MLALAITAVGVAGCGGAGPTTVHLVRAGALVPGHPAPPILPASRPAGSILALGVTDVAAIRPSRVDFASDGTLVRVRWTGWGSAMAVGHGTAVLRICSPNCGQGHDTPYPATITLTGTAACDGVRFYTSSSVVVDTSGGKRRLASFIRNPC